MGGATDLEVEMAFHVVDDSLSYYHSFAGGVIPPQRQGKFVVIRNGTERFAVFSVPNLSTFHAHIVQRFLDERGVSGQFDDENGTFHFEASQWRVDGGGKWRLDETTRQLNIFGSSMAYGRVDLEDLAQELTEASAFGGVEVLVGI
jgi:hypothetical protein